MRITIDGNAVTFHYPPTVVHPTTTTSTPIFITEPERCPHCGACKHCGAPRPATPPLPYYPSPLHTLPTWPIGPTVEPGVPGWLIDPLGTQVTCTPSSFAVS